MRRPQYTVGNLHRGHFAAIPGRDGAVITPLGELGFKPLGRSGGTFFAPAYARQGPILEGQSGGIREADGWGRFKKGLERCAIPGPFSAAEDRCAIAKRECVLGN